jgi:hypothetical protein
MSQWPTGRWSSATTRQAAPRTGPDSELPEVAAAQHAAELDDETGGGLRHSRLVRPMTNGAGVIVSVAADGSAVTAISTAAVRDGLVGSKADIGSCWCAWPSRFGPRNKHPVHQPWVSHSTAGSWPVRTSRPQAAH